MATDDGNTFPLGQAEMSAFAAGFSAPGPIRSCFGTNQSKPGCDGSSRKIDDRMAPIPLLPSIGLAIKRSNAPIRLTRADRGNDTVVRVNGVPKSNLNGRIISKRMRSCDLISVLQPSRPPKTRPAI
jgi:hypothetical protein